MPFLETTYLGNSLKDWLVAVGGSAGLFIALIMVRRMAVGRLSRLAVATKRDLDNLVLAALQRTHAAFLLVIAAAIGARYLQLPDSIASGINVAFVLAIVLQIGIWANNAFSFWLSKTIEARMQQDASTVTTITALGFVGKVALWSVVALLVLDNLGINITAIVAGLGIGGIALALATQRVLGDVLASLSIVLDKPFALGDFIVVQGDMGTVEHIGLKTTRIRSLSGEQIVVSNSDLLESRIQNFKRMEERRVVFGIGVTHDTTYDQLSRINAMVKSIVESQPSVRFDRAHFKQYSLSALEFEVVYYVLSADFNTHMDIQHAINLELYRQFEETGIRFAGATAPQGEKIPKQNARKAGREPVDVAR